MKPTVLVDIKGTFSRIKIIKFGGMYEIAILDPDTEKILSSFEGTWNEVVALKNALCELWDREANKP